MLRGESDTRRPRPVRRDQGALEVAMSEVDDLVVRIQDLGDGFVFGVEFLGQREIRDRKVELGLRVELGAHRHRFLEELGIDTGECRRLSKIRKWPLRLKTHENGLESYDPGPFSIERAGLNRN